MKKIKTAIFVIIFFILFFFLIIGVKGFLMKNDLCYQSDACISINSDQWKELVSRKDSKIEDFVNNNGHKKYIKLSNKEFTTLIVSSIEKSSGGTLKVDWVYWENISAENTFVLNLHLRLGLVPIGLYRIILEKDDTQTIYIYIREIDLNGINLRLLGFDSLLNQVNHSIKESIVFINSESSAPFVFDNIEFLEDTVVLKGHYTDGYY